MSLKYPSQYKEVLGKEKYTINLKGRKSKILSAIASPVRC